MTLKSCRFPSTLNTSDAEIIADFFVPALSASLRYDRGVGFFSAGWLRVAAEGMAAFARNSGYARWVTSPILSEDDWKALQLGQSARSDRILRQAIERNLNDLERALKQETLSTLAWLVADRVLDFKLALPRNKLDRGDFHDKFGVFTDEEGNQISFNGSYNDSIQGTRNYESIKMFRSWDSSFAELVQADAERFEKLWANRDPNVAVFDLPQAARARIVRLRTQERPYPQPDDEELRLLRDRQTLYEVPQPKRPRLPSDIRLRDYQEDAVEAWFAHNCRGLFEMATGTGKTITALAASVRLLEREERLVLVVACPYTHLINQWADVVEEFGYDLVLAYGSVGSWADRLANELLDFRAGFVDSLVVLTTHSTLSSESFTQIVEEGSIPLLLIVDEVHAAGSPKRRMGLLDCYDYRLGLSATPRRWFDDEGTTVLFDYFGDTVFEFPLADAIPDFLVPYEYYPFFVELTDDELAEYQRMTEKIIRRASAVDDAEEDELLELYAIFRKRIITRAENKLQCFEEILDSLDAYDHTLVYCSPDSPEQMRRVQGILNSRGIVQSRFTGEELTEQRKDLLESFASGSHEMLVAMKCLDEGVDVPSTRTAVLLASSGNPKQFIQRRGRVLRKAEGKDKAVIFDIIVVPTLDGPLAEETLELERRILKRELQRYDEFAALALNDIHALNKIGPIKRQYLIK
jgi:superfamily II DNA or RNA helicase